MEFGHGILIGFVGALVLLATIATIIEDRPIEPYNSCCEGNVKVDAYNSKQKDLHQCYNNLESCRLTNKCFTEYDKDYCLHMWDSELFYLNPSILINGSDCTFLRNNETGDIKLYCLQTICANGYCESFEWINQGEYIK